MTLDTTPKAILAGSLLVALTVSIAIYTSRPRYAVIAHPLLDSVVRMDMKTGQVDFCFPSRDPDNRRRVRIACDGIAPQR